jgi:hypothetical protein
MKDLGLSTDLTWDELTKTHSRFRMSRIQVTGLVGDVGMDYADAIMGGNRHKWDPPIHDAFSGNTRKFILGKF